MHVRSPRSLLVLLLAVGGLLLASCASDSSGSAGSVAADPPVDTASAAELLDFRAERLGGGELDGSSLEGTDTVLWFWAPWCTTCRAEAPDVLESAEAFDGRVELVGVAGRGEADEMQGFVDDTGTGSLEHVIDAEGTIWSDFGVAAQPAFAFIDDSGEVEVFVGTLGGEALRERMDALAAA